MVLKRLSNHAMIRTDGAYPEAWGGHAPGTKGRIISHAPMLEHRSTLVAVG